MVVVDDGSSDGTPGLLREQWPAVEVIEQRPSLGYVRAVNRGVAAGTGELVVLVNNDVELRPDFLERLAAPFGAEPRLGSAASLMLARDGSTIDSVGVTVDATLAGFARLQGRPAAEAHATAPGLAGPEGTAGAWRRAAWEQAGGFDERLRAYMEVVDIALRLAGAGWTTIAIPEAAGVHLGSATYGRRSAAQRRLAGHSRGYLLRRYGVLRGRHAARTLVTEAGVVAIDAIASRDAESLRGRLEGWRAARGLERRPRPRRGGDRQLDHVPALAGAAAPGDLTRALPSEDATGEATLEQLRLGRPDHPAGGPQASRVRRARSRGGASAQSRVRRSAISRLRCPPAR